MSFEFWFEFGSTYSYPAAMRIDRVAAAAGIGVAWRPFLLGPIFKAQGWDDSPFNLYPAKGRYMWRDLERICREDNIPFRRPSHFPRNGILAARVACSFVDSPWIGDFVRSVYRANFAEDRAIAERGVVADILRSCGADGEEVIRQAEAPASKARLREQTEVAKAKGIFGAPSFVVGDELFWGNDRLESAIRWCSEVDGRQ